MNKYIGNKNHKLTCLYFVKKEKNVNYYMFACECGKHKIINPIKVFGKNSSTKSCGCLRKEKCSLLGLRNNNITLSIEKTQKRSYYKYRSSAKKRNYSFNLSFVDFINIVSKNCHYCGIKPSLKQTFVINKIYENPIFFRNGIDRKNNKIGYELDNCVACCTVCNRAKSTMDYFVFIKWIKKIAKHNS